jgi:transcription elongation factor GreA
LETEPKSWYFKALCKDSVSLIGWHLLFKSLHKQGFKPKKSTVDKNYLSREGYEKLEEELKDLKTRGRKEIAEEIAEARAKGDLSENAEYDAAKEAQGMLEKRIAELENALANARILDEEDIKTDKAYLLSTVTIYNHNVEKEVKYTLVSKDEANFKKNKISVESPIGQAILGREIGETFEVDVPAGKLKLEVKNIER